MFHKKLRIRLVLKVFLNYQSLGTQRFSFLEVLKGFLTDFTSTFCALVNISKQGFYAQEFLDFLFEAVFFAKNTCARKNAFTKNICSKLFHSSERQCVYI